jgi:hypothetical protein
MRNLETIVDQIAADLIAFGPFDSDDDAIRSLVGCHKYRTTLVMACFEAAKYEAGQMRVAREMSDG